MFLAPTIGILYYNIFSTKRSRFLWILIVILINVTEVLSLTHTHHITTSYPLATPITMQVMCNTGFVQQITIITLANFLMLKLEIWFHDLMNNITLIIPPLL